jgi:hypothetical protein
MPHSLSQQPQRGCLLALIHLDSSRFHHKIYTISSTDHADSTSIFKPSAYSAVIQLSHKGNSIKLTVSPQSSGFPDSNGDPAVLASAVPSTVQQGLHGRLWRLQCHGKIQTSPRFRRVTDLEDQKMKSRGAFSVLMARAGDAENRKVSFEI